MITLQFKKCGLLLSFLLFGSLLIIFFQYLPSCFRLCVPTKCLADKVSCPSKGAEIDSCTYSHAMQHVHYVLCSYVPRSSRSVRAAPQTCHRGIDYADAFLKS